MSPAELIVVPEVTVDEIKARVDQMDAGFGLENVPIEVYHDLKCPGVSKSRLDLVARTPAHFNAWAVGEDEDKSSDALDFGNALHTLILEPHLFYRNYVKLKEGLRNDPRTGAYQEWYSEHKGKEVLKADDYDACFGIRDSILKDTEVAQYLGSELPKKVEYSIWWKHPATGMLIKVRMDIWVIDEIIIDLKSTRNASPWYFSKTIDERRYHVQARMQIDAALGALGLKTSHYLYIALEKTKPYVTQCYRLTKPALDLGQQIYESNLATIRSCQESQSWPGYFRGIQDCDLPDYAYKRL